MNNDIIAIPHFSDPDHFPHIVRCAKTISGFGKKAWAIGFAGPEKAKGYDSEVFYRKDRFKIPSLFRRGPLCFAFFMVKLFSLLWKERPSLLQPIDVPAIFPCWLHSIMRGIPLVYFTLEDIPYMTTLIDRPFAQKIWTFIEQLGVNKAIHIAVVADIDARSFQQRYKIKKPFVIRNVPELIPLKEKDELLLRKKFGWSDETFVLFYHGVIDKGRGIENVFPFLQKNSSCRLAIAGYGTHLEALKCDADNAGITSQIGWVGSFQFDNLPFWLQDANLGIALFNNISPGMYQALPCKLFEYVHSGIPVVASNFPEMKFYIETANVGLVVNPENSSEIEKALNKMFTENSFYVTCKNACMVEREKTNWQNESKIYREFITL